MIELVHLVKRFGDLIAVNGVDLVVPRGEFFAVLGPNAAGKTTTIKILAGLMKPTPGPHASPGTTCRHNPSKPGSAWPTCPIFPSCTTSSPRGSSSGSPAGCSACPRSRSPPARERSSPGSTSNPTWPKPIETLSHGTRQRVAIVSALLHDPEVFVLDEPMVGLDPHHARVSRTCSRNGRSRGMTVFVSTHQLSVAEEMADRIGIMHEGRLIAVGTREELRRQSGTAGALEQTFLSLTRQEANLREEHARPVPAPTPSPQ